MSFYNTSNEVYSTPHIAEYLELFTVSKLTDNNEYKGNRKTDVNRLKTSFKKGNVSV